jgi:hypothetical protein
MPANVLRVLQNIIDSIKKILGNSYYDKDLRIKGIIKYVAVSVVVGAINQLRLFHNSIKRKKRERGKK